AFRDVILENDDDVLCWRREVERRFQRYGRPVDLIINLEGLIVKPSAARSFGAHRAEVLAENTRVSYRFNGNPQTRTSIYTSAVIHGADANIYESRDEALKALLAHRDAGLAPPRSPLGPSSQRGGPTPSQRGAAMGPPSHRAPSSSGMVSQRAPTSAGVTSHRQPPSSSGPVSPPATPAQLPASSPGPAPPMIGPPSLRPGAVPKK
ncbi:MAG TPA: hypothetical protein VK459_11960, partial [Polyangiaceae bacterium]|nr:hypothetical protein [Polyangiaceae bacterium]